ncbi:MAG: hypothetical protein O2894_07980 [Planctomycetota bacterium]|nr:hypothetical protein [Planctomycetota bacterium]
MSAYYIRNEDETVQGPHAPEEVRAWIAEGRLDDRAQYSTDAITWRYARDLPELGGGSGVQPASAFPEPSLLIRQGASIQGPYRLSRIREYVKQRRIQHYMLFSHDGVFWVGPEHVPGLLPVGYVPLPPPTRPTAVSADGRATPQAGTAQMPRGTKPPAPGEDIGSSTLVGFRLDDEETTRLAPPPPPPPPAALPLVEPARYLADESIQAAPVPLTYYVRTQGQDVYGPCSEAVLRSWIEEGRVDRAAEFSNDGRTWTPGARMVALFPGSVPREITPENFEGGARRRRFPRRK